MSDVAFCILSHYNPTLFHLSRQHSCSCNIHYFNRNQNFTEDTSISIPKYDINYLRLTPICYENDTESIFEEETNGNDLIFYDLENKCNYKLMFLDCNAMTTTKEPTTLLQGTPTKTHRPTTSPEFVLNLLKVFNSKNNIFHFFQRSYSIGWIFK